MSFSKADASPWVNLNGDEKMLHAFTMAAISRSAAAILVAEWKMDTDLTPTRTNGRHLSLSFVEGYGRRNALNCSRIAWCNFRSTADQRLILRGI